jgi:hypothetical protein
MQLAELKGSDTVAGDNFGTSVAISGTTAIFGSPAAAGLAGRVYVFGEMAGVWKQTAELKGSDTVGESGDFSGDHFGSSVATSGSTVIVSAPDHATYAGRVYVLTKTAVGWKQVVELGGSDTIAGDYFGGSVAVSGTTAIVGAPGHATGAGRAYVFTQTAAGWKQVAELKGSDTVAKDAFGSSVAISGKTAIVGAPSHATLDAGRAYVFTEMGAGWKQVGELKGSDAPLGAQFGGSVAISDSTAVVGALGASRAYVFTKTSGGWKQVAELKGFDTVGRSHTFVGDAFGYSVAVSGSTAIVGACNHANGAGRAYVFNKTSGAWKQVAEVRGSDTVGRSHTFTGDLFGWSATVSVSTAIVGAPGHGNAGRAYVFEA